MPPCCHAGWLGGSMNEPLLAGGGLLLICSQFLEIDYPLRSFFGGIALFLGLCVREMKEDKKK